MISKCLQILGLQPQISKSLEQEIKTILETEYHYCRKKYLIFPGEINSKKCPSLIPYLLRNNFIGLTKMSMDFIFAMYYVSQLIGGCKCFLTYILQGLKGH